MNSIIGGSVKKPYEEIGKQSICGKKELYIKELKANLLEKFT